MKTVGMIQVPPIKPGQEFMLDFPKNGEILDLLVATSPGGVMTPQGASQTKVALLIAVLVDSDNLPVPRKFCLVGSGMQLPETPLSHCGSALIGTTDFHLFEMECPQVILAGD